MAFILATPQTVCGYPGEYVRIADYHSDGQTDVINFSLIGTKALREAGASPLPFSLQLVFSPGDHPLSELDPDVIITELCDDIRDLERHTRYVHTKAVLATALAQPDPEKLTSSEHAVLVLAGSVDDL